MSGAAENRIQEVWIQSQTLTTLVAVIVNKPELGGGVEVVSYIEVKPAFNQRELSTSVFKNVRSYHKD